MSKHLVFVGGVHGAGKTTFCAWAAQEQGYAHYSAGALIRAKKGMAAEAWTKAVADVRGNQALFVEAVGDLTAEVMIIDGHFTLRNQEGGIEKIEESVFAAIGPTILVVLVDTAEAIAERLWVRDGIRVSVEQIQQHQEAELAHARALSLKLSVPLFEIPSARATVSPPLRGLSC